MSKLLRLPLTLLAVLAALLYLPGIASAGDQDPPSTTACAPLAEGCTTGGTGTVVQPAGDSTTGDTPTGRTPTGGSDRVQGAAVNAAAPDAAAVPNCDSLPSDVLPPC